jgi:ribose 5-phosphate isomerase A
VVPQTLSSMDNLKRSAALRAAEWIRDGMVIGLGTGSTVRYLLDHLAERRAAGDLQTVTAVPTSEATAARAAAMGIRTLRLDEAPIVDLTIDGADEVDPKLNLIKGLGGAMLREKIVASVSRRMIVMVDESKRVERLGIRTPVPVEVEPFGLGAVIPALTRLGARPVLRTRPDGEPVLTDGLHLVVDCHFDRGITDPYLVDRAMQGCPGVLETGLFLGIADLVIVASPTRIELLRRAGADLEGPVQ